ncbi:glycosyltransferase 87 family protein [Streptomyces abyssomicinicus]|uniref:glycosyltransferase family 87 protein n=1 Tax=Streptomyces abyssomicinicus TaxID=574929 RepID=UPI0015833506
MCAMPSAETTHQSNPGPPEPGTGATVAQVRVEPVSPTHEDPVAVTGSEFLGGPSGRHMLTGTSWWSPVRVVVLVAMALFALGLVQKAPCYNGGWFHGAGAQYTHACYSDIPHLYHARGFAEGLVPYFDRLPGDMDYLEYPVLTGVFMEVASWLTPDGGSFQDQSQNYWMVNAGMLMVCAAVIAVCAARTHARRPWDGLLVALAPAYALTATINWDLLAVALTAGAMLMWARSRPLAFGVLLGLATAAKLYPVFLLAPLLALCWRSGRLREYATALAGAAGAWLVVNVPVMLFAFEGWSKFYRFSQERSVDFGSFWLILDQRTDLDLSPAVVNPLALVLTLVAVAGVMALCLSARRRPRFAQVAFLVVAAFILTNKVYSPQYVLWLVPLAALARPRWRDFLIWQTCEVMYFLGIWMYLAQTSGGDKAKGLPLEGYQFAIVLHLVGTLFLCAVIVRDIVRPEGDVVRRSGEDDPSGGVLDGAPDTSRRATGGGSPHEQSPEDAEGSDDAVAPTDETDGDPWKYRGGSLRKEKAAGNEDGNR